MKNLKKSNFSHKTRLALLIDKLQQWVYVATALRLLTRTEYKCFVSKIRRYQRQQRLDYYWTNLALMQSIHKEIAGKLLSIRKAYDCAFYRVSTASLHCAKYNNALTKV